MGLFTQRKLKQASEAVVNALNSGLRLRHLMAMAELSDEALKQSEAEARVAESLSHAEQAWATDNIWNGAHSVAVCLMSTRVSCEATATLWSDTDLAGKIHLEREKFNLAAKLAGLQTFTSNKDFEVFIIDLRKAMREAIKEASGLFTEAATAIKKAEDGL